MFVVKLQDNSSLSSSATLSSEIQKTPKKRHQIFYAIIAVTVVLVVIGATVLLIPQNEVSQDDSSPRELSLNYAVGERMVYENINAVTNQMTNTEPLPNTDSYSTNSTIIMDVISENSKSYTVKQTGTTTILDIGTVKPVTLTIDKSSFYKNFVEPQGQFIFNNINNNPTLLGYLDQDKITVGDVWIIPINTGDASLEMTGEVTLKFAEIQEITVPAGTFQTMRIEVTSKDLSYHTDYPNMTLNGKTVQINDTSYVEMGTFRLIKADLTQTVDSNTVMLSEKTLVEFTKP